VPASVHEILQAIIAASASRILLDEARSMITRKGRSAGLPVFSAMTMIFSHHYSSAIFQD